MPTFNEYQDEYGYFIRARPSSTENPITYQIEPEGYSIVESYGLTHQDEISWDTIQTLKSLGLISTKESGIIGTDEFNPDPEQLEKASLSDEEAYELLECVQENRNLSTDQLHSICSILNIEPPDEEIEFTVNLKEITVTLDQEDRDIIEEMREEFNLSEDQLVVLLKVMEAMKNVKDSSEFDKDLNLSNEIIAFISFEVAEKLTA